ncbi:DinB family protein [Pseudonocardia spinosispora]|uniref:DinB family protein n=1 Tax=Pseudonocardia spinosispora TaxID=103441 RepID=UPI00041FD136|nr:DinB family protein [Pseudonocardia spinosispora]
MAVTRAELIRWQFDLTWSLVELHLDALKPGDLLWEPAALCWTVRPADGRWVPDWSDTEPDPIPVPTIGWITWHMGWWWSVTLDHLQGREPRERTDVEWPGGRDSVVEWLRDLRREWLAVLARLTDDELDGAAPFPWSDDPDKTVAHTLAWVNAELMKNIAEVGQLRLLRGAGSPG